MQEAALLILRLSSVNFHQRASGTRHGGVLDSSCRERRPKLIASPRLQVLMML